MITKCHAADCRNGDSVGKGLRESGLDRDDVFVTTNYACGDLCRPLFGPFSSEFSSRYQRCRCLERVREDQRGWIGQVGIIIAARGCSADIVTK